MPGMGNAVDRAERAAEINLARAVDEGFGQRINRVVRAGTGLKLVSSEPSVIKRAMRLRMMPSTW